MAKQDYLSRYNTILGFLEKNPYASFDKIFYYLERQGEMAGTQELFMISKRTFQRDILDIEALYDIEIKFCRSKKGYYINKEDIEKILRHSSLYEFEMIRVMKVTGNMAPYLIPEKRYGKGIEYLSEIALAIKRRLRIKFDYQKFEDNEPRNRTIEPYVLKEFKNRWYVIGREDWSGEIKTFGLDRMSEFERGPERFRNGEAKDIEDIYQYCFGIIAPHEGQKLEKIELFVSHFQYNYLRTLPLHFTQEQIRSTKEGVFIKLLLYITHDLVMELLSLGNDVKVLQPPHLAETMKATFEECVGMYEG